MHLQTREVLFDRRSTEVSFSFSSVLSHRSNRRMAMENEAKTFFQVWSIVIASLCFCFFVVSKIPHGKFRFLCLLPIFYLFTVLPLSLSSVILTGMTAFFITWLANFKLLLFCFNLGPLSQPPTKNSLLQFIFVASFPIKINPASRKHQDQKPRNEFLNFWSKILIYPICLYISDRYVDFINPKVMLVIHCAIIYLFLEISLTICNKVIGSILGVELDPPFDEPYLSTSLQEFWGRRWNLMVTDILRLTVHQPIRSMFSGKRWASLPAVMATFLVSAVMHEVIFFHMTRVMPTWEVTWFFVLHGVGVILELVMKKVLGSKWRLHPALSLPLTAGFVMATGFLWFFPHLLRNSVDSRSVDETLAVIRAVRGVFDYSER